MWGKSGLWVLHEIVNKACAQIGLDWLSYLAGNSQMAPNFFFHNFSICFVNYFMKKPQTTFAPTFFTHSV
jgi:hypothetical protein